MRILALDIGGTYIKSGISDEFGTLSEMRKMESESQKGGDHLINRVKDLTREYRDYDCIGISTMGQVNREEGCIIHADDTVPGYSGMRIKDVLEEEFGVPVIVENDAYCAALGEGQYGSARGSSDFVMLTYGTGVGGAIMMDYKLYKGHTGVAGEFGSMITRPVTATDPGCYGRHCSTAALIRKAVEVDEENTSGEIILEKIRIGDRALYGVLDKWALEVSMGIATIIHVLNPPLVILGGGIMEDDFVVDMVKNKVDGLILDSFKPIEIVKASLGNRAGMLGAASLFL